MADFKIDKYGGEYREVEGKETYALWVPMTGAEKEALVKKAKAENVDIAALTGNALREWMKTPELSAADLEKVAGGGGLMPGGPSLPGLLNLRQLTAQSMLAKLKGPGIRMTGTVMCPW